MKYIKRFEDVNDNLIKILITKIIRDDKVINGFSVNYDSMNSAIEWTKDNYILFATPYWDGYNIIPINIINDDGDEINQYTIKISELKSENNIPDFIEFYYSKIEDITASLNKRTELKKAIRLISKSIGKDFLDSYYNLKIKDIDQDQIPDSDVNNLLTLLNDKYPHIIQSDKFNL